MDFLVVDDDRLICEGIVHRLREMSDSLPIGRIFSRYCAEDALELLAVTPVDVLITDIRMYEMDGLTLIGRAKDLAPDMGFIIVTAHHELAYTQQAIRMGVDDFLLKPYSVQAMRETISRVAERLSTQRARTHCQLNLALQIGITKPDTQAHALFGEHGIPCPKGPLRLVLWHEKDDDPPAPPPDVWLWRIGRERCMLVWHDDGAEESFRQWLQDCSIAMECSLGVSGDGISLEEMSSQAARALRLSWYWTMPKAVFDAPPVILRAEDMRKVIRHVAALDIQGARKQLAMLLDREVLRDPRQANALYEALHETLAQICVEYELDMPSLPLPPAPYTGLKTAFYHALATVEQTISTMTNESILHPVSWAKRYVRDHLGETIDMAHISRKLNISYSYFSKIFKEQTGETFSDYQQILRVQEAKRLLMLGISVTDIAQSVGYANVYTFTRAFTKRCGVAPSKWRKEASDTLATVR